MHSSALRFGTTRLAVMLVLVLGASQFIFTEPSLLFTLTIAAAWAIAAVGLDLLIGYVGVLSFGQAAFVAVGAYGSAIAATRINDGLLTITVAALGGAAVVGGVIGFTVARLSTFGAAVGTFFAAYLVSTLLAETSLSEYTGGSSGLLAPFADLFGQSLNEGQGLFTFAVVALLLTVLASSALVQSEAGRAMQVVRMNDSVASTLGVSPTMLRTKVMAFAGMLAGLAGLIYGLGVGYLSPESFSIGQSTVLFSMLVVGGMGTIAGPVVGAVLLTVLTQQVFDGTDGSAAIIIGAITLATLVIAPDGIVGLLARVWDTSLAGRMPSARTSVPAASPTLPNTPLPNTNGCGIQTVPTRVGTGDELLVVNNMTVTFGAFVALKDVNVTVHDGECHAIIGPNGAGKSTLMNALSGLVRPRAGSVSLGGERLDRSSAQQRSRKGLSRTFQTPSIVPDLSSIDNVKLGMLPARGGSVVRGVFGRLANGRRERELERRARAALAEVQFPEDRYAVAGRSLSLSELKHLEVARAVAGDARVIMMDEPTAGLSSDEIGHIQALLIELKRQGRTVLVIAHHLGFVSKVADRVSVLDFGSILETGTPQEILGSPTVAAAFSGAFDRGEAAST